MVHRAEDPEWLPKSKIRSGTLIYKVDNSTLIIQRKNQADESISMGDETDAITALVVKLNDLDEERNRRALQVYDMGLHNYITRMLQKVVPWLKEKNGWQKIADTLHDYKGRERLGIRHDVEGRERWLQSLEEGM